MMQYVCSASSIQAALLRTSLGSYLRALNSIDIIPISAVDSTTQATEKVQNLCLYF